MTKDILEIMTPHQVADILQVHIKTVYDLINTGKLKAAKLGPRSLRIRVRDLEQFIEAQIVDLVVETRELEPEVAIRNANNATEEVARKGEIITTKGVKLKEVKAPV